MKYEIIIQESILSGNFYTGSYGIVQGTGGKECIMWENTLNVSILTKFYCICHLSCFPVECFSVVDLAIVSERLCLFKISLLVSMVQFITFVNFNSKYLLR